MSPTIDLTRQLDKLENSLPALPAQSVALGRASVRRTNDVMTSAVADVTRRIGHVVTTARTGVATTTGRARSAVDRTTDLAQAAERQPVGQARAQSGRTTDAAVTAAGDLFDEVTDAVDPDAARRGIADEAWRKADLYERAQQLDIVGRSGMSKPELIAALRAESGTDRW